MVEPIALDRPLPGEVLRRVRTGLSAYQNYPVFSAPWLRRRTLRLIAITGGLATLMCVGTWISQGQLPSLAPFGYFMIGFTLIGSVGPALATVVRHRRWPLRREQRLVIVALLLGVVASAAIDGWVSAEIDAALDASARNDRMQAPFEALLGIGVGFVLYAVLGGGVAVPRYFNELRRMAALQHEEAVAALETRHRELDAQLGLLQAQVEPHFLFNTLASVHSLIGNDPQAAQRLVNALVGYLRATIPRLRDDAARIDATLGQQLEICASYLEVMQTRMGGRLEARVEVPAALHGATFPPLLLMTLVENCIKHGIEPKPGPGYVAVRAAALADDVLEVEVVDDGAGLRAVSGGGLGLVNLRASLLARYGERAWFALAGGLSGGTTATLRIPLEWSASSNRRRS